ncbi:MAG: DUF2851 family protein [Flavobacteriaceae bacterium]|nr:DUF2851 family protein [Flavobacteriaceae bacterium]
MKEEFLHYVWKNKLYDPLRLRTTNQDPICVINSGLYNQNAGPDFLNSKIDIADQIWFGNVEIHIKSSDWYSHHHEVDENYDAVILHVVWEHDNDVYMKNNLPIATVELKQYVDPKLVEKYHGLSLQSLRWIPCEKEINTTDSFLLNNWLERLFIERLERKSTLIEELLDESNNDWERVLFCMLAKNFGLKVNGDAFFSFAKSIPYAIVRKEQHDFDRLSALFFGQARFLSERIEDAYHAHLKKEYEFLSEKYQLDEVIKNQFLFFRMRPSNFPTIRIAQLVALYHKHKNIFSELMKIKSIEEFYALFVIDVGDFWETHYNFTKESKRRKKGFTKSFLDLLFINTVIPLQFSYQRATNELDEEQLFKMMNKLKPEKNNIVSKFSDLKIEAKSAFESQALLELKNNYCAAKRCLECAIGNQLLRN